mgnify:CR=1 FL=1
MGAPMLILRCPWTQMSTPRTWTPGPCWANSTWNEKSGFMLRFGDWVGQWEVTADGLAIHAEVPALSLAVRRKSLRRCSRKSTAGICTPCSVWATFITRIPRWISCVKRCDEACVTGWVGVLFHCQFVLLCRVLALLCVACPGVCDNSARNSGAMPRTFSSGYYCWIPIMCMRPMRWACCWQMMASWRRPVRYFNGFEKAGT